MDVFQNAVKNIIELLKQNGVELKGQYTTDNTTDGSQLDIECLDFSEHDKDFLSDIKCLSDQKWQLEREIEGLQEEIDRIKKLNDECCEENIRLNRENKEIRQQFEEADLSGKLSHEPIETAMMLINAENKYTGQLYDLSKLRQIAEHLLVYCNNNEGEK